jgi:preprotein translocase subunit SecD
MIIGLTRFNNYLLAAAVALLACGCRTHGDKPADAVATLRVHLEVIPESMDFSTTVPIYRQKPVLVTVDRSPFLTEANVADARVADANGSFSIQVHFDRQGTWLLEAYTATSHGKHLAVFSAFSDKAKKDARWLAAPAVTRRISNGILAFTPDATREEAELIVQGLNNVARKNKKASEW